MKGLRELGWVDGKNIELIWRSAEGDYGRRGGIIDEFIRFRVDVIVVFSAPTAQIALQKTRTIPIVHASPSSLTEYNLIESLARPGGNLTGVTSGPNLNPKRLALLKAVAPATTHVGLLNQIPASQDQLPITVETRSAASVLGLTLMSLRFWTIDDLEQATQYHTAINEVVN